MHVENHVAIPEVDFYQCSLDVLLLLTSFLLPVAITGRHPRLPVSPATPLSIIIINSTPFIIKINYNKRRSMACVQIKIKELNQREWQALLCTLVGAA